MIAFNLQNSTRINRLSVIACWKLFLVNTSTPSSSVISPALAIASKERHRNSTDRILLMVPYGKYNDE